MAAIKNVTKNPPTEANILAEPRLIGRKVGVPAIAILLSIYAGIKLFGFWGIIGGPLGFIMIQQAYISLERRRNKLTNHPR